mgnify:CR=1 FL=1
MGIEEGLGLGLIDTGLEFRSYMVDIYLLAEGSAFLGAFTSNAARLAFSLMSAGTEGCLKGADQCHGNGMACGKTVVCCRAACQVSALTCALNSKGDADEDAPKDATAKDDPEWCHPPRLLLCRPDGSGAELLRHAIISLVSCVGHCDDLLAVMYASEGLEDCFMYALLGTSDEAVRQEVLKGIFGNIFCIKHMILS